MMQLMHVLLVDDNDQFRTATAELLMRAGHTVRTAGSGVDAMRCLREAPADLVITAIVMPGQDGFELMMKVRQEFPHVGLMAVSGDGSLSELYLKIATKLGAVATLLKPFAVEELLIAIARIELGITGKNHPRSSQ